MSDNLTSGGQEPPAPPPEAAVPTSKSQRRTIAACHALHTLIRDYYQAHFGARPPRAEVLPLSLVLSVKPREDWAVTFDPPLEEQIHPQIEDAEAVRAVYERGRIHCFRCESSHCEHSAPPDPLAVFKEYTSTGIPAWAEMVQLFIESRDTRVDRLYDERPAVLARMQYGHELKQNQLSPFGRASKTYCVLGQVVAGYFVPPARMTRSAEAPHKFAVTFQIVETRGSNGGLVLRFNTLPAGMPLDLWEELLASTWKPSLSRACQRAANDIEFLQRAVEAGQGAPADLRKQLRKVPSILLRLVSDMEGGTRKESRRTRHAQERSSEQRPVSKAADDARVAKEGSLYFDEKRGTYIACGKVGRTHAFNAAGKHVTSFTLPAGGADFRVRTRRWRPLSPDEVNAFHALVDKALNPDT